MEWRSLAFKEFAYGDKFGVKNERSDPMPDSVTQTLRTKRMYCVEFLPHAHLLLNSPESVAGREAVSQKAGFARRAFGKSAELAASQLLVPSPLSAFR